MPYSASHLQLEHSYSTVQIPEVDPADVIDVDFPDVDDPDHDEGEILEDYTMASDNEFSVSNNVEIESSCHECIKKDEEIKVLKNDLEKLKRQLTIHRREREKQRVQISNLEAGSSFFRADQQKFLKKKNLRGYTWSKETLRDALKIRFSGKSFRNNYRGCL